MDSIDNSTELKFSAKIQEQLFEHGIHKDFDEGETIISENAYLNSIPIVIKGSIKVLRTDDEGREILLYYIKAGESCIMSFLGSMHNDTSKVKAIAEENTNILFIPIEKVISLNKDFPEWLDYVFRLYHKRFEELLEIINEIAFKKVDERLLALLNKKRELMNNNTLNVTHEQLANELGTARVVVSRLLKQLEDNGVVQLGRNKIIIM